MDAPAREKSLPNQIVINTYGQKNNFLANSIKRLQFLKPVFELVPNILENLPTLLIPSNHHRRHTKRAKAQPRAHLH